MKAQICMKKKIVQYKAVLFDMDGTLYHQTILRFFMGGMLFCHCLFRPWKIKDIGILRTYRLLREKWKTDGVEMEGLSMEEEQYHQTAARQRVSYGRVVRTVTSWMHEKPLNLIKHCKDTELACIFTELHNRGVTVAIYSDYPAVEKLGALSLKADAVFASTDQEIGCMKPERAAMDIILKKLSLSPDQVLMIGDRMEKDGLAAKNAGIDYVILPKSIPARRRLYRSLLAVTP